MARTIAKCVLCNEFDCDYEQGQLCWHEALDRSHVACEHFYEYVQMHPAVQHNKELDEAATLVVAMMQGFYQLVGRKYDEFEGAGAEAPAGD